MEYARIFLFVRPLVYLTAGVYVVLLLSLSVVFGFSSLLSLHASFANVAATMRGKHAVASTYTCFY